jgi:hypothetical protein
MLSRPVPVNLVEVVWLDAEASASWETELESGTSEDTALVLTVGFLVKETKAFYYISGTVSRDEDGVLHWNGRLRIPRAMVKKLKVLQKGE